MKEKRKKKKKKTNTPTEKNKWDGSYCERVRAK